MDRLQSILVGVDFTPSSASALRQAIRIAEWNRARLKVIHVLETPVVLDLEEVLSPFQNDIQTELLADAGKAWSEFATKIPGAGGLDFDAEVNHPVTAIIRRVAEHSADLLVLGTYGTGDARYGAGTLASACVRRAPTKVLLVRDPHVGPFTSIVACIDFSDISRAALENAVRVAAQDSAKVHIVHVFSGPWHRLHYRAPTPQASPDYEKQYRDALERRLRAFCEPLQHELNYLKAEYTLFEHRSHGRGIAEFAARVGADLVVLGTRGRTTIRDIVLGSTAERVLLDAPCSILTIPPQVLSPTGAP